MKTLCKSKDGSITYTYDDNFVYAQASDGTRRLDLFDQHYYKLRVFDGVPVLEIDGLRMQLVRDFKTPLEYASEVVKLLNIPKNGSFTVLDTCMGLGYTAIEIAKNKSVSKVITCEISEAVMTLARWNPFSAELFDKKIETWHGSSYDLTKTLEDGSIDYVIHDPPRYSHAIDLYSVEFYQELYRICKTGSKIFHYVGAVGKNKGRKIEEETKAKLEYAGFKNTRYNPRLQGIYVQKGDR